MDNIHGDLEQQVIGDDWIFQRLLVGQDGTAINLVGLGLTVGVTYFAPAGSTPASTDISSSASIIAGAIGMVNVIVPHSVTSLIPSLPSGRKRPTAHVQIYTTDANGLKTTQLEIVVDPFDPSTADPRCDQHGQADYHHPQGLGGGYLIS